MTPTKQWTPEEDAFLRARYPTHTSKEVAEMLGCNHKQVWYRANKLGIEKAYEFRFHPVFRECREKGAQHRYKKGREPENKGKKMPPEVYEKVKLTMFRKGQASPNELSDGAITERKDNTGHRYLYIRLGKSKWELYHRHVWIKHNGPIPRGMAVVFRNGDYKDCSIENLELVSRAELMSRNNIHNQYPEEIVKTIRQVAAIKSNITKLKKKHNL